MGSSPRPRGAQESLVVEVDRCGLIPASAGSTIRHHDAPLMSRAHPRVRGEHARDAGASVDGEGSSPRPRGARFGGFRVGASVGLIPASAGSTYRYRRPTSTCRAHPRVRGEHAPPAVSNCRMRGSSPRPRGARGDAARNQVALGLIPASAGSTMLRVDVDEMERAHPRVRGEHAHAQGPKTGATGSSPRPRGAHADESVHPSRLGLIPASAGSTIPSATDGVGRRAHPRVRGEHHPLEYTFAAAEGSSPRPRGARRRHEPVGQARGLIPASAGSTSPGSPRRAPDGAHPRVRGEHLWDGRGTSPELGSSPRPRGARSVTTAPRRVRGLIPASAGSTGARNV